MFSQPRSLTRSDPQSAIERLTQNAQQAWSRTRIKVPSHLLVWVPDTGVYRLEDGGEIFAIVDDDSTIVRMMNQKGQVYSAVKSGCHEFDRSKKVFVCPRADMILCSGQTDGDLFVGDNVVPLIRSMDPL